MNDCTPKVFSFNLYLLHTQKLYLLSVSIISGHAPLPSPRRWLSCFAGTHHSTLIYCSNSVLMCSILLGTTWEPVVIKLFNYNKIIKILIVGFRLGVSQYHFQDAKAFWIWFQCSVKYLSNMNNVQIECQSMVSAEKLALKQSLTHFFGIVTLIFPWLPKSTVSKWSVGTVGAVAMALRAIKHAGPGIATIQSTISHFRTWKLLKTRQKKGTPCLWRSSCEK